jgi:hypothetical protein
VTTQIDAYPTALKKAENELIAKRRKAAHVKEHPRVGFALSGGGIRSATFSLGVFQALSRLKLLGEIDYLSTVSGGGYFGSFLGTLFTRDGIRQPADVEKVLLEESPTPKGQPGSSLNEVIGWLRENGRYLAPNGAGDALLAGAAVMRNWIAIQTVMASLVLAILLFVQIVRMMAASVLPRCVGCGESLSHHLPWGYVISWSPFSIVAVVVFLALAAPPLWAYWLVERRTNADDVPWIEPIQGLRWVGLLSMVVFLIGLFERSATTCSIAAVLIVVAASTLYVWRTASKSAGCIEVGTYSMMTDEKTRILLTRQLKTGLVATGAVLAFVVVDSLGQTLYAVAASGQSLWSWAVGVFGPIVAFASVIQKVLSTAGAKSGGKRLGLPLSVLAGAAAIAVALMILVTLDVCAHAFAWDFDSPGYHQSPMLLLFAFFVSALFSHLFGRSWPFLNRSSQKTIYASRLIRAYLGASNPGRLGPDGMAVTDVIDKDDLEQAGYWPLFAKLGGKTGNGPAVCSYERGAPLHLVNVTINETLGGRSQVEQHDRKGIGMAIGPAGVSAGVIHHLVINDGPKVEPFTICPAGGFRMFEYERLPDEPGKNSGVVAGQKKVSAHFEKPKFAGEMLTLGNWTSISGAAVSTGLGARTSLGASFLLGFANARLGYWWDSGVDPQMRERVRKIREGTKEILAGAQEVLEGARDVAAGNEKVEEGIKKVAEAEQEDGEGTQKGGRASRFGAWFNSKLPVQSFLLDEFLARFHGPGRRWWYLTDGGHFENMGGYELIRRRLPMIVVIDAEDDADYTFEGIANLVRKARIDFGAEIDFVSEHDLNLRVDESVRKYFGTPEQLRRGVWAKEPVHDPNLGDGDGKPSERKSLRPLDESALSIAHAALADVTYSDGEKALLLYIKPTLTGDEPSDVRRYHSEHPSFPQETTAEQFFDEAQWESYRKLGEHIAEKIFSVPGANTSGKFLPYNLRDPRQ